jgi:hypothetical protein
MLKVGQIVIDFGGVDGIWSVGRQELSYSVNEMFDSKYRQHLL